MKQLKTYKYRGPLELGSVISHNCGAAGLFSTKDDADVLLIATENNGKYTLELKIDNIVTKIFTDNNSSSGRSNIGRAVLQTLRETLGLKQSEWGDLVGVRPTKFFHKKCKELGSIEKASYFLQDERKVSCVKTALLKSVVKLQQKHLLARTGKKDLSVYAGIPFCTSHCSYCSFPFGLVQQFYKMDDFIKAYVKDCKQMEHIIEEYGLNVDSVYMGGGTPTSLDESDFETALRAISKLSYNREFTVEAGRPDTVTPAKIKSMQQYGVNRLSINPQTMQDHILKLIGRTHKASSINELYDYVREHTSFNINMDFIAGLPKQTLSDMKENMAYVCQKMPENVTIHTLALKKGSPLYNSKMRDHLPSAENVKEMVEYGATVLEKAGYKPYYLYRQQYMRASMENIGYTLPNKECIYNIQMMEEQQTVLAIGPGSTSKWINPITHRQKKQYMPRDVHVYIDEQETLRNKRALISREFYGEE